MSDSLHVFAVGIETYRQETIPAAAQAANDALAFGQAWEALGVAPANSVTLLNAEATKTVIEAAFKKFTGGLRQGDSVVLFFSGYGLAHHGENFLIAHDSELDAMGTTGLSFSKMLKQLSESKSDHALLFIDAGRSGLPIPKDQRTTTGPFTHEDLKSFCAEPNRAAFLSCGEKESSWSSHTLQHGLWTLAILRALKGEAKPVVLAPGTSITGESLQAYLEEEVPRLVRLNLSGNQTQTPCAYGDELDAMIVVDLAPILATQAGTTGATGNSLKDATIRGVKCGEIRKLSGFTKAKGHKVPDNHSNFTENLVKNIGAEEVQGQADAIHAGLREAFSYKRRDISYVSETGVATIKTPDFDVSLSIQQDGTDPAQYILVTEVGVIRRSAVLMEDGFLNLFSDYCDTVVVELSEPLNLQDKIDEIEDSPQLRKHLTYEPDCSSFKLALPAPGILIEATARQIIFSQSGPKDLKTLLGNIQSALSGLSSSGVALMLPDANR